MDLSILFLVWVLFSLPWQVAFMRGVRLGLVPSTPARLCLLWLGYLLDACTLKPCVEKNHPSLLFVPIFSALIIFFVGRAVVVPSPTGLEKSATPLNSSQTRPPKSSSERQRETPSVKDASLEGRIGAEYVGTFRGRLVQGGNPDGSPIETIITLKPSGKLAGSYIYKDPGNQDAPGKLVQQGRISNRTVRFKWIDDAGTGSLVIMFKEDYNRFEGEWSADGEPAIEVLRARRSFDGLTWSGNRVD